MAGGNGGGKPDFAMAGAKDLTKSRRGAGGGEYYCVRDGKGIIPLGLTKSVRAERKRKIKRTGKPPDDETSAKNVSGAMLFSEAFRRLENTKKEAPSFRYDGYAVRVLLWKFLWK